MRCILYRSDKMLELIDEKLLEMRMKEKMSKDSMLSAQMEHNREVAKVYYGKAVGILISNYIANGSFRPLMECINKMAEALQFPIIEYQKED